LERIRHLARVFIPFLSLQAITQVVAAVAGIAVVRRLPVHDFAVYAVAAAVQASLAVLSDFGVTSLLMAKAGQFHTDLHRVAVLARTAQSFRQRLLVAMLLLAGPLLWVSLGQSRPSLTPWLATLGLVAGIVTAQVYSSLDGTLLLSLLRAEQQQLGQLVNAAIRLLGFVSLLVLLPSYLVALGITLVAAVFQSLYLRLNLRSVLPVASEVNESDRAAFNRFARSQFLNAAYYAFSGQITIWIVGIVAPTRVVAEVGALGRLSNIIVLAQGAVLGLVAPRMARYREPGLLLRRYLQVLSLGALASAGLLTLAIAAPGVVLWIIGPKYSTLAPVLPIAIGAGVTYALSVTVFSLNAARAWLERAWVAVPLTISLQVISLLFLNLSILRDALIFGWLTVIPPLVVNSVISWNGLRAFLRGGAVTS
jgi:hypothetical protein